ncbi:hypothetical protein CK203_093688 [Vitis vinifera]|uniref:Uncharacterized protein n=1 Tax=Vitis vinifera TaxID=29760 RepID=A0A438D1Y4_VITVI|nr:hypothetical protein CK203_093688 [Vitis vinifera]
MHLEFREELWRILDCKALPPRLFIKGGTLVERNRSWGCTSKVDSGPSSMAFPLITLKAPVKGALEFGLSCAINAAAAAK